MEYQQAAPSLQLSTYIARQSVFSATSSPIMYEENEIHLESAFQKRLVMNDLSKQSFHSFQRDGSQFLLIDFIDERYNLISFGKSLLTGSVEMMNSGFLEDKKYKVISRQKEQLRGGAYAPGGRLFIKAMDDFVLNLLNIYPATRLILHKAYLVNFYRNQRGEILPLPPKKSQNNDWINAMLKEMYSYMENKIPHLRPVQADGYAADENHKWGLAAMHYEEMYYIDILNQITQIVGTELQK
ncbi:MAG: hypothetical protein HFG27_00980 [Provencibacterium sp.]|nr:hypothetical protein [Provencibacterium sp.]